MTLRTALLPVVDTIRGLAGPDTLDIRPFAVTIRTRRWSEGAIQCGTPSDRDIVLVPRPRVRVQGREALIGPITPEYEGGGYSPDDLNPADNPGVEFYYVVTGPDGVGRPYSVVDVDTSRPFGYVVRLIGLDRRVPF